MRWHKSFSKRSKSRGMQGFVIPGNHDCYTRFDERERTFYNYFPTTEKSVYHKPLEKVVAPRCYSTRPISTSPTSARGDFSKEREAELLETLEKIPSSDSIILMNHFPLFAYEMPLRTMKRCDRLQGNHFGTKKCRLLPPRTCA